MKNVEQAIIDVSLEDTKDIDYLDGFRFEAEKLEDIFEPLSDDDTTFRYEFEEAKTTTESKPIEIYSEVDKIAEEVDPTTVNWF